MSEAPKPLSSYDLATARLVATAFRCAYRKNAGVGLPYYEARVAARRAYLRCHPRATEAEAWRMADEIMGAVEAEHGAWLWAGKHRLRYDPER